MGLEDFFEDDRKKNEGYMNQSYDQRQRQSRNQYQQPNRYDDHSNIKHNNDSFDKNDDSINWTTIIEKIRGNRKLKILLIVGGLFLVVIVVVLLMVLLPLIMKLFGYVGQNGLQGIIDNVTAIINKILNGTK
jgi:hypothetical protein